MRRFAVLVFLSTLIAGCGEATPVGDFVSTTLPGVTTQANTTAPIVPTSGTTPSLPPTSPTTSSTSATTTTAEDPSSPFRADGTLRSLGPADYFPPGAVGTAADVPWDEIGPGWILTSIFKEDADAYYGHVGALVLLDPADQAFVLGGWQWIRHLQDWSPDGLRIVYTPGMDHRVVVVHLLSGVEGEIATDSPPDVVRFTRPTGRDIVIGRLHGSGAIADVYRTDGSLWSHLLRVPEPDPSEYWVPAGWLYGSDGMQVVVFSGHQVRLLTNRGDTIRNLPIDGVHCSVPRWWSDNEVLVSCIDPDYAETGIHGCWPGTGRELWAVPIDGSAPRPVGPQTGPGGDCDAPHVYEPPREDALLIGATLVIKTGGCCECGGDVEVWLPDEVRMPPLAECSPRLVGIRNNEALVHVTLTDPQWRSGIVSIDATGQARLVAPQLWEEAWAESVHLTDDAPGSG